MRTTAKILCVLLQAILLFGFATAKNIGYDEDQDESDAESLAGADTTPTPVVTLHEAITNGDTEKVKNLLADDENVDLNSLNAQNETPLQLACKYGHLEIVKLLINKKLAGSDEELEKFVEARQPVSNWTALFFAANSSSGSAVDILKKLINDGQADWLVRDSLGRQAIHVAISKNQTEMAFLFLLKDSSLADSKFGDRGKTASHLAAEYNVVDYPEDFFNGSALDALGQAPSCYAALSGSVEFAEVMMNARTKLKPLEGNCIYGETIGTPLHVAVIHRQLRYLQFLLGLINSKTDDLLNYRDNNKATVMHALTKRPIGQNEDMEIDSAIAMLLYKKKQAEIVEAEDLDKRTPFLVAIQSSAVNLANFFRLKTAAKVRTTDRFGFYALHLAQDAATVDFLRTQIILNFTDINLRSAKEEEFTPLHVAILHQKSIGFIQFLLHHDADPTITDKINGSNALHMAIEADRLDVVEVILSNKNVAPLISIRAEKQDRLTPLLLAIKLGRNEIAKKIISSPHFTTETLEKEVVSETEGRETALHLAAELDRDEIVEALIARFYSSAETVWSLNSRKQTFLHKAVEYEALRVVKVVANKMSLESIQRAVCFQDRHGRTVIHLLATQCSSTHLEMAGNLVKKPIFERIEQVRDIFSEAPLQTAVKIYCIPMVKLFLQVGSSGQCQLKQEGRGLTALHEAKLFGYDKLVSAMTSSGKCSLEQRDSQDRAVSEVEAEIEVAKLASEPVTRVAEIDFDCFDESKKSGRLYTSKNVINGVSKWTLKGYCYNKDESLVNSLIDAIQDGSLELVRHLLQQGADLEAKGSDGRNALHTSVYNDRVIKTKIEVQTEIVKLLLDRGAKINVKGHRDRTPLNEAAIYCNSEVVKLLLEHGADITVKNDIGATPLHGIATNAYLPKHLQIASLLLDRGASINEADLYGETPLIKAVSGRGNLDMVKLLVDRGADLDVVSSSGSPFKCPSATALKCAAQLNKTKIVEYLKTKGASRQG